MFVKEENNNKKLYVVSNDDLNDYNEEHETDLSYQDLDDELVKKLANRVFDSFEDFVGDFNGDYYAPYPDNDYLFFI